MHYPKINGYTGGKYWVQTFAGLDRRPRTPDGAFSAMGNMVGEPWPLLCSRPKRRVIAEVGKPLGMIAMDKLAWIDGTTLYYDGEATPVNSLSVAEDMLPKRMVSMGAYLLIFPDGVYYNTQDAADHGSINRLWQASGQVTFTLCNREGAAYPGGIASSDRPANPTQNQYWLDTGSETHGLWQYTGAWISVPTVYIKIGSPGIGQGLSAGDGVKLSGIAYEGLDEGIQKQFELLNATHQIVDAGADWIITAGIIDVNYTQTGGVRADRQAPAMDFVIESNNRLWGCRKGSQDGETVNALYACALGDFKNWAKFEGTSQDSYTAAVGSDGPFTGAIAYGNKPYFFKEKAVHAVYGDKPASFNVQTVAVTGPQEGSGGTVKSWKGNLYYLSRHGVQIFDGMNADAGQVLGEIAMTGGAAGVCDNTYYMSVTEPGGHSLYALDCERKHWYRQDDSAAVAFAELKGVIYMLLENGLLYALNGEEGTEETAPVTWYLESGVVGYEFQERKYLSRFLLKMELGVGDECTIKIQYDGDGTWHRIATVAGKPGVKSYTIPIIPRRCECAQLRLEGQGTMRLYGIGKVLGLGSDVR